MSKEQKVDWAAVEREYRANKMSNRQIAARHGISEAYVRKRAKEEGWDRGKKRAQPAPVAALPKPEDVTILPLLPKAEGAVLAPGDTLGLAEDILCRSLHELEAITAHIGEIEAAIEAETAEDVNGRRRSAMLKAVSLPARAQTLRTLLQAKELIDGGASGKLGKKEQAKADAQEAVSGGGRFAPMAPPKLVVNNGKP